MRANEFIPGIAEGLTEIENLPARNFDGKRMLRLRIPAKRNLQPLLGGTDLLYAVDQAPGGDPRVVIVEPGVRAITKPQIVAVLQLEPVNYLPNTVQVGFITVDEDYRGRGLAKALYGIVFTKMRKNLLSGDTQTPGGKRNWMSLVNMPGVQVKGLVQISNDIFDFNKNQVSSNYQKYIDQTMDQIMELGGQFFHKNKDFSFWLFDVVPGKGQLQPYVQNSLSKLYGYDARNLLLATWNRGTNESQQGVEEAFNQPYATDLEKSEHDDYDSLVQLPDGSHLSVMFNNQGDGEYQVEFWRGPSQGVTGEGDAQRIFATVLSTIQRFIKEHTPWRLTFSATKDVEPGQNSESRAKLYNRLVDRYAAAWGYDALINDLGDQVEYELTRLKPSVSEGFPNFNREWDEATRYPEFVNLGKEKWIELVSKGKPVTVTRKNVNKINNTDAADPTSFKLLDPEKQKRALAQLANGDVEMPIVARYSDGYLELIGGNTRLTAQMAKDGQAKVWLFNVPEELTQDVAENFADGKVKGKSRPGRVKRSGASCDGSVTSLRQRAKNASGEKAKMYHWCANMKSGKKK